MTDLNPKLHGVHHTAFPTWKPKETVEFYRDVMGLKPIHAITAKGWGRDVHPDFVHFFFEAGENSAIAFFYYIGTEEMAEPAGPRGYLGMARHTSWTVESEEELEDWKARLEAKGVKISEEVQHEVIRSLYFRDPNGYPLEISLTTRAPDGRDAADAELTLQAMIETFADGPNADTTTIEDMWRRKGELVAEASPNEAARIMPALFILDVPEFAPLVAFAENAEGLDVTARGDYRKIHGDTEIIIPRAATGLGQAVWFGILVGGFEGRIAEFSDTKLVISP